MWKNKKVILLTALATALLIGSIAGVTFAQTQTEMQNEALQSRLQNLVSEGKMTQEQADEYLQWWQSRPDTPLLEPRGGGGMMGGRGHDCWGGPFTPPETSDTSGS